LNEARSRASWAGGAVQSARDRIEMLSYLAIGSENWQYLPVKVTLPHVSETPQPKLKVNHAGTLHGFKTGVSVFLITGEHMKDKVIGATVQPLGPAAVVGVNALDGVTVVRVDPLRPDVAGVPTKLHLMTSGGSVEAADLVFDLPPAAGGGGGADAGVTVTRDGAGRVVGITINGRKATLSPAEAVEVLKILGKGEAAIRFGLDASGGVRFRVAGSGTGEEAGDGGDRDTHAGDVTQHPSHDDANATGTTTDIAPATTRVSPGSATADPPVTRNGRPNAAKE
jgi:hypothetical protein